MAYVTLVVDSGAGAKEAQELARHSTPNLTMNVYARTQNKRLVEVVNKVGDMVKAPDFYDTGMTQPIQKDKYNHRKSNSDKEIDAEKEWWRRRESNPRPKAHLRERLHA